ncbi:MAG: hypothetical protein LUE86_09885 [Clostridiales bacterium]|nr:hypothetical protein [Clostridiales bacterium]
MRNCRWGIGFLAALACLAAIGGVLWYACFGHAARREPDGTLIEHSTTQTEEKVATAFLQPGVRDGMAKASGPDGVSA